MEVKRRGKKGLTQSSVSNSKKLSCPLSLILLYSVGIEYNLHCPHHGSLFCLHFSVGSEFRKRGAIYWAPNRILKTILFPISLHTHTYNRIVLSSRSHELVGSWPDPTYIMFCLAHRISFGNNCTKHLKMGDCMSTSRFMALLKK